MRVNAMIMQIWIRLLWFGFFILIIRWPISYESGISLHQNIKTNWLGIVTKEFPNLTEVNWRFRRRFSTLENARDIDPRFLLCLHRNNVVSYLIFEISKIFLITYSFWYILVEDANAFLSKSRTADNNSRSSYELVKADLDNDILTNQDSDCIEKGQPLKNYDAFVIYHDDDIDFASTLIENCKNMGYSICSKDGNLLGGSFESDAILNLLTKRCNRLIIIISKAFLKSPMQLFITNFAQALGIEQGQRKIIPCLTEPCELPQMLRFCFRLDLYRNNKLFNFWDKLDQSLKSTLDIRKTQPALQDR